MDKQILVLSNCPVVEHQGSGYVIVNTAKCLEDLGYKVDIIPPSAFSFLSIISPRAQFYRILVGMAIWVLKNQKSINHYRAIIVYGSESSLCLFVLKFIIRTKVPIILHSNGIEEHVHYQMDKSRVYMDVNPKWYHFRKSFINKYCYKHVDLILTVSKYDGDFVTESLKIPVEKVFYNEPCLPEIFFDSQKNAAILKKDLITYCGTWIARKGVQLIEKVIPDILRKHPEYTFRIIGTSPTFELKDYFPNDIIERIEVFPLVKNKEHLIQLYKESSIFLFPSFCESFGLVVPEAMFCECAVITGPTGYSADLVDGEEATVLESPNTQNVYSALEKLIINPDLRSQLARQGKIRSEALQWNSYRLKLEKILTHLPS